MAKHAVSLTLEEANLLWLRGQTAASGNRSLSDTVDRLITEARTSGRGRAAQVRSVVGTLDVDPGDPLLDKADEDLRRQFHLSLARPFLAKESRARFASRRRKLMSADHATTRARPKKRG